MSDGACRHFGVLRDIIELVLTGKRDTPVNSIH